MLENVTCPFCGCLCDDIRVTVEDGQLVEIHNGCALSQARFGEVKRDDNRHATPVIRIDGESRPASYEEAMDHSIELLNQADHPLLYGWANTCCEAQKLGVELAEMLGASIDDTSSICHGPSTLGIQDTGYVSATLGTVKNRADFLIYWGCNPFHAHPRHISRYTVFPRGYFRGGREERKLVVVDPRRTTTSRIADLHLQPDLGGDFEVLNALRVMVNGGEVWGSEIAGIPAEELHQMAEEMKKAEFGALFFGLGLSMSRGRHRNVEAALQLVRDLNRHTKWIVMAMRGHYNVAGFNEVCAWETGYPFSVDFTRGYPRYNPGETSAVDLIRDHEVDAMMTVAADPVAHLPASVAREIRSMPTVAIDPFRTLTTEAADVVMPTQIAGIETPGTAYRMDGVPIELKQVVNPPEGLMSDREVLTGLLERQRRLDLG